MNPHAEIRIDVKEPDELEAIWCEFLPHQAGWASLKIGFETGSRPVSQTLTLALSNAYDPIPELIRLAECGVRLTFPFEMELVSEGPISVLSLNPIGAEGLALLEIRDWYRAIVYLAAIVNPRQFGYELALAIAEVLIDPAHARFWREEWDDLDGYVQLTHEYHEHAWFRTLLEDSPRLQEYRTARRQF